MSTQNSDRSNGKSRGRPENLKPFKPGQSGNPGGRPKKRLIDEVLTELLETADSSEALAVARALIKKAKKGDSKAAQLVAERTQGKPKQKIEMSGSLDLKSKSDEELKAMLQTLIAKL